MLATPNPEKLLNFSNEYINDSFLDETPSEESDGVEISRFPPYVEEMKKNKNHGFQNEFKVIVRSLTNASERPKCLITIESL
jgi:hypothetical protein